MVYLAIFQLLAFWAFAAVLWAGREATKLPQGTAEDMLATGRPDGTVVACLGDSITHGRVGYHWVSTLREKMSSSGTSFINAGINGNVAWQLGQRIDPVLKCKPDVAVVLIGTNDVMGTFNEVDARSYVRQGKLPETPSIEFYRRELTSLLDRLKHIPKRGISTLPPLGEDPSSSINELVGRFNVIVEELAHEHGFTVLPLNHELTKILRERSAPPEPDYLPGAKRLMPIMKAVMGYYLFRRSWDGCAERAGLVMTPDYIHLGERAGGVLGGLVEDFIRS